MNLDQSSLADAKSGRKRKLHQATLSSTLSLQVAKACAPCESQKQWESYQLPFADKAARQYHATQFYQQFDLLNERQMSALVRVWNDESLFLTGGAGTGKTTWMSVAIGALQYKQKSVNVCAMTGLASTNIVPFPLAQLPKQESQQVHGQKRRRKFTKRLFDVEPRTLHSFAGIRDSDFEPCKLGAEMKKRKNAAFKRWKYCDVLFIDEISMLSPELFVKLDTLAQVVRSNSLPWGGIQLVLVADFFQLPPILNADNLNNHQHTLSTFDQQSDFAEDDDQNSENGEKEDTVQKSLLKQLHPAQIRHLLTDVHEKESDETKQLETELLEKLPTNEARYCFQVAEFDQVIQNCVVLQQVFRQKDNTFVALLNKMRVGALHARDLQLLHARTRRCLQSKLLQTCQGVFGMQNCEWIKQVAFELCEYLQTWTADTSIQFIDLSKMAGDNDWSSLLQHCAEKLDFDNNKRLHPIIAAASESDNFDHGVVPNWIAVLQYASTHRTDDFDTDEALLRALPHDKVPRGHHIVVSSVEPTKIMSTNAQVNAVNKHRLQLLRGDSREYSAAVVAQLGKQHSCYEKVQQMFVETFEKMKKASRKLVLKIGAQVLFTVNFRAPHYVNGSRGVVVGFMTHSEAMSHHGDQFDSVLCNETVQNVQMPMVQFTNGRVARIGTNSWQSKKMSFDLGRVVEGRFTQIPLILAFAITIHRSQGMTIDSLSVDLTRAFECGLPYVAVSRATGTEGLILEDLDEAVFDGSMPHLLPPLVVLALYNQLERKNRQTLF